MMADPVPTDKYLDSTIHQLIQYFTFVKNKSFGVSSPRAYRPRTNSFCDFIVYLREYVWYTMTFIH